LKVDYKKVSIIIPIFNAEMYLFNCLESVKFQNYSNFEVILIDDGSVDSSKKIIDKFLNDNKFRYYYQKNAGVSAARNYGLSLSKGEYIVFLDADDLIGPTFLEDCIRNISDVDIVFTGYNKFDSNHSENIMCHNLGKQNIDTALTAVIKDISIFSFPWGRMYKKSIIDLNNLTFNSEIHFGEDLIFNVEYLNNAESSFFINSYQYFYRENGNSISGALNSKSKLDKVITNLDALEKTISLLEKRELKIFLANRYLIEGSSFYRKSKNFKYTPNERLRLKKKIRDMKARSFKEWGARLTLKQKLKFYVNLNYKNILKIRKIE